ncbi:MAG: FAD-binding oxidoreductase [Alphaproteobacteria bacterium]|nr:FAD-binding oxidoreductase [Alphaproteobacteria bacterium]
MGTDLESLTRQATLSRGLGRSYGDASLPAQGVAEVVGTRLADRMLAFDEQTGVLRAQAGLSLHDLARTFLPRGWFSPVSPGTWYVTLGGMVASDIHGKNHHVAGTIGRHVRALRMRVASGEVLEVTRSSHPDLFAATLGGMGLTGHILEVELQLQKLSSPWIWRESIQCPSFDELLEGVAQSAEAWPQTVAWIDTLATGKHLGKGVLMRGRWARPEEAPARQPRRGLQPTVPFLAPSWAINDLTVRAINFAYYHKQIVPFVEGPVTPHSWFTPLDSIKHWSRAYGRRGFTQHQAVIPREAGLGKVREYCELIAKRGGTGLLCVLKDCGPEGEGLLSFPKPGISVPIDLPVKPGLQDFIDELNRFVLDVGGRIYLTKDGFTRREHFEAMEADRLPRFREVRRTWDPDLKLRSAMSQRLLGDPG